MTKANINNVKIGDKAYIEVEILDIRNDKDYPIKCDIGTFTEAGFRYKDSRDNQLYIKEEIPTLGEGVEMEVSDDGIYWEIRTIIAKIQDGKYITKNCVFWKYAKPIELTIEQKYENVLKEIEELKKQLNGK